MKLAPSFRSALKILIISCLSLLFILGLSHTTIFKSLENKAYDSLFYFRPPLEDKGEDAVIVAIDDESMAKVGSWPWPRGRLAELIKRIKQGKPKVIGIDLLLDIPSAEDQELAEAFRVPVVCVIPVVLNEDRSKGLEDLLFKPLDIFLTDYAKVGVANISYDPVDKTARNFKPVYGKRHLSFPLAVCLEYLGMGLDDVRIKDSSVEFGRYKIPVYNARSFINYKCAKIDKFSAGDIMDYSLDPAFFFEGKIVLLGRTDLASKDFVNTPVPSGKIFENLPMVGVEVWKEVVDMILAKNFLYRLSPLPLLFILSVLSISISAATSYSNRRGTALLIVFLLISGFIFYASFLKFNLVMPLLYMAGVCLVAYIISFLYNYVSYQREKNMITAAFKSYVSDHILEKVLSQKVDLKVGGKRKMLTVLFADIKGFTDFADKQDPEKVLEVLKMFFSEINKVIIEHNGIIDKLMGDGILAFFGDFMDTDEHAIDAVKAALKMQEKLPKLREHLNFDLVIRIGIHAGYVTVGNIGSYEHLDYTVVGKNVNLAKRLESACEPGKILISDFTYQMVRDKIVAENLYEVSLKGFVEPVKVCSVVGLR
ncbi:MAG: adenylate/guanylate cyclase domain-containing protein [Candidatus Omnitrophica bacterium]|nr:adenylate/guanylate cyclase domain-containing protein [Candidatus Omnitrophota bacterium]